MSQVMVRLNEDELHALVSWAQAERRHPREQAAYIIHAALVKQGVLKAEPLATNDTASPGAGLDGVRREEKENV